MYRNKNLGKFTPVYNQANTHTHIYQNCNGKASLTGKRYPQIPNPKDGKSEPFPWKSEIRRGYSVTAIFLEVLTSVIRQEKDVKDTIIGKKRNKMVIHRLHDCLHRKYKRFYKFLR